jgi:hypothetical protein
MQVSRAVTTLARAPARGFVMQLTRFSRSVVFGPDTLKKLEETFDKAWAAVSDNFAANARDVARLRLATIVLEFAAESDCNWLELRSRAIDAMQLPGAACG